MSENRCKRCGRELGNPRADYGWRCAQILGYAQGNPTQKDARWDEPGYRVVYDRALKFLETHGFELDDVELELFLQSLVDLIIADYNGDEPAHADAFWRVMSALYPGYDAKGKRVSGKTEAFTMESIVSVLSWIDDMGFIKSLKTRERDALTPDDSMRSSDGRIPSSSKVPIDPLLVLEQMMSRGDEGSYAFWSDPQEALGGKSRMEAWTFPMRPEDIGDANDVKIRYNFGEDRKGGRIHAGLDIIAPDGTPILAVTDGIVVYYGRFLTVVPDEKEKNPFDVFQVVVLNDDGSVVRYAELEDLPIPKGAFVRQGDIVGYTEKMKVDTMLHIEVYDNIAELNRVSENNLTQEKNTFFSYVPGSGFQRRKDLINPTMFGALGLYTGRSTNLTKGWK